MYKNEFINILDDDEEVLWSDKPNKLIHLSTGFPMLIIGIIWGILDSVFIIASWGFGMFGVISLFMLLHLMPLWIGIGGMIRLLLSYKNTFFCYSNKRIIIKKGFWGVDYNILDYDMITTVEVNVSPMEKSLGVGTIRINEEYIRSGKNTTRYGKRLYGISNPYQVFKELKQITMDVKTDINFPNEYRPEINPGYNTKYRKRD